MNIILLIQFIKLFFWPLSIHVDKDQENCLVAYHAFT